MSRSHSEHPTRDHDSLFLASTTYQFPGPKDCVDNLSWLECLKQAGGLRHQSTKKQCLKTDISFCGVGTRQEGMCAACILEVRCRRCDAFAQGILQLNDAPRLPEHRVRARLVAFRLAAPSAHNKRFFGLSCVSDVRARVTCLQTRPASPQSVRTGSFVWYFHHQKKLCSFYHSPENNFSHYPAEQLASDGSRPPCCVLGFRGQANIKQITRTAALARKAHRAV